MAFTQSPGAVSAPGLVATSHCQVVRGSKLAGDAVFYETSRNDGRLLFLLIDVMGHGDPAAPYVELLERRLLTDPANANLTPGQLLSRLHSMLAPVWAEEEVYVCATAFTPLPADRAVVVANAGLPTPMFGVIGHEGSVWDDAPEGVPLGLPDEGAVYEERNLLLERGVAFFFTDGVSEAHQTVDGDLVFFGYDRLQLLWRAKVSGGGSHSHLISKVFGELATFAGVEWPQDDVTTLCVEFIL